MSTLFRRHVDRWQSCTRCLLCKGRTKVVLARGQIPCDVLFIGEGPGESENLIGAPFIGPAGKLLDSIIRRALFQTTTSEPWGPGGVRVAFTNLVACIPRNEEENGKAAEPPALAIKACGPRLQEFVKLAEPKLVVCVGTVARDWLDPKFKGHVELPEIPTINIVHPAFILRMNVAMRGLAVQKCVVTISNAIEELT